MNTEAMTPTWRDALAARREARTARRRLAREIADFRTPAERLELEAILDRHPVEATQEIRRLLARQAR